MTVPRKLRILALHGYTSNEYMLSRRMGAIRKACRDVAEFHFLNGPHRVKPITTAPQSLDAPETSSQGQETGEGAAQDVPLEEQPRAWWKASDEGSYEGWDTTVEFLNRELLKAGEPFDGVFGFSQGACMAALVASAFEDPSRLPNLRLPPGQGPLRFCVAVSGFQARDPSLQKLFPKEGIQTPVLHVRGRNDQIVDAGESRMERSQTLVNVAANSRVDWHDGGHSVPSQAPWRHFFADFFSAFLDDAPHASSGAPGAQRWRLVPPASERPRGEPPTSSSSTTSSGANTPTPAGHNKPSL